MYAYVSFGRAYEIFVETEADTVTLGNAEIDLYNGLLPAGYGYMTETGETEMVPEPGTGEIVVTEWAYRRFFPDEEEGVFSHIGEEVTLSLEHVRSGETDAQFTAKIVAVELNSRRDPIIYCAEQDALALKACCGNGERLFADLSKLNAAQLTALLQELREEYNVCTVNAVSYDVYMSEGTFQNTGIVFALIAGIMLVVSLLLIANMLSVMIADKRREIGILRALGGGKADAVKVCLAESGMIAILDLVLSLIAGGIVCVILNHVYRCSLFSIGLLPALYLILLCFGAAALATVLPALRISRRKPVEILREK